MVLLLVIACASPAHIEKAHTVRFSRESGFYDEPFYLELECDDGDIYYTLDSSDPDENSIKYTSPILVNDPSTHTNVYCMIRDVSLELNEQILINNGSSYRYGYQEPKTPVDKATIIRAVCVDRDGNAGDICTGAYFIGFSEKDGYDGIYIMSIITDPDDLFDYNTGIYITGRTFDEWLATVTSASAVGGENYGWWPANYQNRGKEWERKASITLFNQHRDTVFSGDYGIRIQGGSSRGMLPKSLNIYARGKKKKTKQTIDCSGLFNTVSALQSLNLYSGAHCMRTKLNDYLMNTAMNCENLTVREFVPCACFLDGEYWGCYWLSQRFDGKFFRERYGVYEGNVIRIKTEAVDIGNADDIEMYRAMKAFITDSDIRNPDVYKKVCQMIDIQSCIDYYASEIYICNKDWPDNNVSLWRVKDIAADTYSDGRWRWIVYDVNVSMIPSDARRDFLRMAIKKDPFFASLMENDAFSTAVYHKLISLAIDDFNPGRIDAFIDNYEKTMVGPMEKEYDRFYGGSLTEQDFIIGCEDIRSFFYQRYNYIMENYGEYAENKNR